MSLWSLLHDLADPVLWPRLHRIAWRKAGSGGPCPHDRALAGKVIKARIVKVPTQPLDYVEE